MHIRNVKRELQGTRKAFNTVFSYRDSIKATFMKYFKASMYKIESTDGKRKGTRRFKLRTNEISLIALPLLVKLYPGSK